MSRDVRSVKKTIERLLSEKELAERRSDLYSGAECNPTINTSAHTEAKHRDRRWRQIGASSDARRILEPVGETWSESYKGNIENLIGEINVPLGLAGPLRLAGLHSRGSYWLPLATTEAALVASFNRGCRAINQSGGARSLCVSEGTTRSPAFCFRDMVEGGSFCAWIVDQIDRLKAIPATVSQYAKLEEMRIAIEGNHIYLDLEFTTGDAAGQNMVTLVSEAICHWILEHSPVKPQRWYVESNMSGDKKASMASLLGVRGKKVSAEVVVPEEVVRTVLRSTPEAMEAYWRLSAVGGILSGTTGVQGQFANGMAALFLATGQDVACVSEASVGVTRMEINEIGSLYASVTLPNVIVGTVGGGTGTPTARACLELMGLHGSGHAQALAEVVGGLCLAGELSIIAALSAGHFAQAHRKLARVKPDRSAVLDSAGV